MKPGLVVFAGAGPGAPDLMTVRCREAIAAADVIIYAGSLVNPELLKFARAGCRIHDSAGMDLGETVRIMTESARAGERVLRLHTGDPAIYGAIAEQMRALDAAGIPYEVIPGVSSVFACAAALKSELTLPGVSQTIILTRRAGRTPVPAGQDIAALAAHRATMAIFLSADEMTALVDELLAGGYAPGTPAAVVYRASWPDERVVRGTLADIVAKAATAGIRRQAIVLVGGALSGEGDASRLYAADFTHGYRTATEQAAAPAAAVRAPGFTGRVAVYALTAAGAAIARKVAAASGGTLFAARERAYSPEADDGSVSWFDGAQLDEVIARQWRRYDGHVFVMATGIVVRKIAPLLSSKTSDPAVVACDEKGRFAVSLLAGHIGGANRLAGDVAAALGGQAVVTTATDAQGVVAFDELAARYGWRIENPAAIKDLNSLLLARGPIGLVLPVDLAREFYGDREHVTVVDPAALPAGLAGIVALDCPGIGEGLAIPVLRLARPGVVLGIGCNRGVSADDIEHAVRQTLKAWHIEETQVRQAASVELKQDEAGLNEWAARHRWDVVFVAAERLKTIPVPNPSPAVEAATGSPSVAEAAALAVSGGRLIVPKQKKGGVTVAVAVCAETAAGPKAGRLLAVGIGSGTPEGITGRARAALLSADVVVGYKPYCDQIQWLVGGKRVLATGMRDEVRRCREAIEEAACGQTVAVVCSGDAGVYGMAGLLMELLHEQAGTGPEVEVVPGVTSALDAAAALGAPLMNDYATISLSDLLTPRATIVERLRAVAACGMACVLYNPRSRQRHSLFEDAIRIFASARGDGLACGFVRDAGRQGQETWTGPLRDLPVERVDMSTLVIFGSTDTVLLDGRLVTRRGYKVQDRC